MSSIRLLKDRGDKKRGEIISVPFLVAKTLIADGTGEYPDAHPEPAKPEQELKAATKGGEKKGEPHPATGPSGEPPLKPEFPPTPTPHPTTTAPQAPQTPPGGDHGGKQKHK